MSSDDFIQRFKVLHAHAKTGALAPDERAEYAAVKEKFAQAICAAQRVLVKPGQQARASFRVAVLFKVELMLTASTETTATMDVSEGGFSSLLAASVPQGTEVSFKMHLPKPDTISGRAVVASADKLRAGNLYRVSFAFSEVNDADTARLEEALFDAVLPKFIP